MRDTYYTLTDDGGGLFVIAFDIFKLNSSLQSQMSQLELIKFLSSFQLTTINNAIYSSVNLFTFLR